jgi:hypothetical protein
MAFFVAAKKELRPGPARCPNFDELRTWPSAGTQLMGLLPIFLTLTAFVFLWGLVNYNSFVAKQARIDGLRETQAELQERLAEIVGQLSDLAGPARAAAGSPPMTGPAADPTAPDFLAQLAAAWRRFAESQPSPRDGEEVVRLLNELEATADAQHRTRGRLSAAIAGYNGHRQRMPYRLIARLFNFKPISRLPDAISARSYPANCNRLKIRF